MRAVLMIPMWKRPELTNYVFRYYDKLKVTLLPDIELILLAIGSEGEVSKEIAERNGFDYVEYPNMPLNRKHNAGIERARIYNPDKLFVANSDNIISANYFKFVATESKLATGLLDLYFLNFKERELGYWEGYQTERKGEPLGIGRCFDREVLERCSWQLWPQEQKFAHRMDGLCKERLASFGIKFEAYTMADIGCFAMDVKTDVNICSWNDYNYKEIIKDNALNEILRRADVADILDLPIF